MKEGISWHKGRLGKDSNAEKLIEMHKAGMSFNIEMQKLEEERHNKANGEPVTSVSCLHFWQSRSPLRSKKAPDPPPPPISIRHRKTDIMLVAGGQVVDESSMSVEDKARIALEREAKASAGAGYAPPHPSPSIICRILCRKHSAAVHVGGMKRREGGREAGAFCRPILQPQGMRAARLG